MSDKLSEELLEKLEEFRNCKITYSKILYTKEDEQLYQEMRKRVQKSGVTKEWIENQLIEEHGGLKKLKEEFTEKWIEEKSREFWDIPYYDCSLQDVKDFIRSLIEEIK